MRSACLVRTRFILNNFSGIGLGGPRTPRTPLGYAPEVACTPISGDSTRVHDKQQVG